MCWDGKQVSFQITDSCDCWNELQSDGVFQKLQHVGYIWDRTHEVGPHAGEAVCEYWIMRIGWH